MLVRPTITSSLPLLAILALLTFQVQAATPGVALKTIQEDEALPGSRFVRFNPNVETVHPVQPDLGQGIFPVDEEQPSVVAQTEPRPAPVRTSVNDGSRWSRWSRWKLPWSTGRKVMPVSPGQLPPATAPSVPLFRVGDRWDGVKLPGNRLDSHIIMAMRDRGQPFFVVDARNQVRFVKGDGTPKALNEFERGVVLDEIPKYQANPARTLHLPPSAVEAASKGRGSWWGRIAEGSSGLWSKAKAGLTSTFERLRVP